MINIPNVLFLASKKKLCNQVCVTNDYEYLSFDNQTQNSFLLKLFNAVQIHSVINISYFFFRI